MEKSRKVRRRKAPTSLYVGVSIIFVVLFVHQTTPIQKNSLGRGKYFAVNFKAFFRNLYLCVQFFRNRSYRFYRAQGAKDNHFKSRLSEMFLEEYHNQEKLLKQEQNRNYLQQQEERDDDLTELQIEENFTFLGIKNRQNRFIKVRPNEFADITKLDNWVKYFERIQKDELFDAKITLSTDECKLKLRYSTYL